MLTKLVVDHQRQLQLGTQLLNIIMVLRFFVLAELRRRMRWERILGDRMHPLDAYYDEKLFKRYRFSEKGFSMHVTLLMKTSAACLTPRNYVMLTLRNNS